jgi:hypothetical protein
VYFPDLQKDTTQSMVRGLQYFKPKEIPFLPDIR